MRTSPNGFVSVMASAKKLVEHNIPFAVIIGDNDIKAYLVTKENWQKIVESHEQNRGEWNDESYIPIVQFTNPEEIEEQFGWIIVGSTTK